MRIQHWAAVAGIVVASHASAAVQGGGTLSLSEQNLTFTNTAPAVGVNVTTSPARTCIDAALPCDQFTLDIDLPNDLVDYFPASLVSVSLVGTGPSGADDLDIYLLDSDGNELESSTNPDANEGFSFLANPGLTSYTLEVQYYIALGTDYTIDIKLNLGEADPAFTDEEVAQWLADNGGSAARAGELLASCKEPGVTVLTDAEGDGGLTLVPFPGTDLLQADIYQTTDADGEPLIAIRLKVDDLSSPIPQSVYFVSFNTFYGDVRGVRMEIDSEGAATFWSYIVGPDSDGDREGHFVEAAKPANSKSNFTADGLITFFVKPSDLALLLPGDILSGFNAGATTFVGVDGAGVSFNNDAMPDGLARTGEFEYLAAEDCVADADARVSGTSRNLLGNSRGGAMGWLLLGLGLLSLARRRR